MRVYIEDSHLNIINRITNDINKSSKRFLLREFKAKPKNFGDLLFNSNISIENKKLKLVKELRSLLIKTFSVDIKKIKSKSKLSEGLKFNLQILRALVYKLRSINHYLEINFLREINLLSKFHGLNILRSKNQKRLILKDSVLQNHDLEKLEFSIYHLINKIAFLDKDIIKKYKRREKVVIKKSSNEIKDIKSILKKESIILAHIEAKLPPAKKMRQQLLKKKNFNHWVINIFALLTAFETEFDKEKKIYEKLKCDEKIRKILNKRIITIRKEKDKLLKIKELRAISMKKMVIDNEWRLLSYQYHSASTL